MGKQKFLLFLFGLFMLICFSCSQKIHCPEFEDEYLVPKVYKNSEFIKFINTDENTLNFEIINIRFSEAYHYDCKDLHNICFCESYAIVFASNYENDKLFEFLKIELNDNNNQQVYRYSIMDFDFEFDFVNDLQNLHYIENIDLLEKFEIDNEQYHQVVIVHNNDSESTSIVDKVYFNKEYGILKIVEKANSIAWTAVL